MKSASFIALALAVALSYGCVSMTQSVRIDFPVEEGKLIPKETALEYVTTHIPDTNTKGAMLYSIEGSSVDQAMIKMRYKGEKTRHYGYYGLTVEVRKYDWTPEKGKHFALLLTGTAGPGTLPGRRIFWFEAESTAKDVATALIALGTKPAK
ncbi:MAG: hypothetical protein OEZ04_12165 [Nitrospinota bacterium]|nr:hypothetical protein [Nitrospinota bacterium]